MKYFLILICASLVLSSCEKVIDLNLKEGDQRYVIEGFVNKDSSEHFVKITKSLIFSKTESFPTVDDALVNLSDDLGNSVTLQLIRPGLYKASNYLASEGRTYTLTVQVNQETFSATSRMPFQVPIDSITVQEFSFGPKPVYSLVANRLDPAGVKNYYSFNLYKGNKKYNGIYLQDDQFADGVEILEPIFGADYAAGDTAYLEMMCIDANVFKYFYTLDANGGGTGGAVPANPDSNFGNKCLGYFSAQTKEKKMKIIPN